MSTSEQQPEAGPSSGKYMTPGPTQYHESSQFRHWRYSKSQLQTIRSELNQKSVEVVARNTLAEKEAQISLGHDFTDPPPPQAYLTVEDELLLLRFYCSQVSNICRTGFGLPEVVESTAISYLKRFYLKNSVMEWHPKNIMPTCLFLAAKTTNYPVPIDTFVNQIKGLSASNVLETEFLVAQSLSFEFWARGAEKPLRGWTLDFQDQPGIDIDTINKAVPAALDHLHRSRLTDVEFLYTPSQIALSCIMMSNDTFVRDYLDWRYASSSDTGEQNGDTNVEVDIPYGMKKERLLEILHDCRSVIEVVGNGEVDLKKVKGVDKRLRGCLNPEKIPGTALYIKRKAEQEAQTVQNKAMKIMKTQKEMSDIDNVFGASISASTNVHHEMSGMGIKAEGMGMMFGGEGLKDVGKGLDDD